MRQAHVSDRLADRGIWASGRQMAVQPLIAAVDVLMTGVL